MQLKDCDEKEALPHLAVTLSSGITNSGKDNCKTLLFAEEPEKSAYIVIIVIKEKRQQAADCFRRGGIRI